MDGITNFAKGTLLSGHTSTSTSIELTTGGGSLFPAPSTDGAFNIVWWNTTDYDDPADDPDKEIVRCTARTADVLTITRAQEGTVASDKNDSGKTYKVILSITKKVMDDIETDITNIETDITNIETVAADGWNIADAMTYVSTTTFSVVGDQTGKYHKGCKIKLTNDSATKTYYVSDSTYSTVTTVTIAGEVDLVSGSITNPHYSYADCPQGFKRGEDWYRASAYKASNAMSFSDAVDTIVQLDTTRYDPNSNFSVVTYKYTIPVTGSYLFTSRVNFTHASGKLEGSKLYVYQDASALVTVSYIPVSSLHYHFSQQVNATRHIVKGKTISLYGYADSSDGTDLGSTKHSLSIQWIGV